MKVLLLANQPASTTRLQLFRETLAELGYSVLVPSFETKNWISIARSCRNLIVREKPDIVHIFNVPDVIYRSIPSLKGSYFRTLVYDYRSPWGIEYQMNFGRLARTAAEHFEKQLALRADAVTTVNTPLCKKVRSYLDDCATPVSIIPNYPKRDFLPSKEGVNRDNSSCGRPVLFVGRICTQEGIQHFIWLAREVPELQFWIVGDGPFSWWHLVRKPENLTHFGWQPHEKVAEFIVNARICLIPREENALSPYSNDRSIWKLNEYLNLGKLVIASGISSEEVRKNLIIVNRRSLAKAVRLSLELGPQPLGPEDYRFWEDNRSLIQNVYKNF